MIENTKPEHISRSEIKHKILELIKYQEELREIFYNRKNYFEAHYHEGVIQGYINIFDFLNCN